MDEPRSPLWVRLLPLELFLFLLAGTELLYGRFFPNSYGFLGHDFSLTHPGLLDGAIWFWNNSILDVPWFTPSFCGGQPFFADAQSAYYSPLQWLAFLLPPTQASHADLLLCCSLGYWAFYFLFKDVFGLSARASVVGGALAMLNSFLPCRFLLGEAGYQLFPLVGFVAHALLARDKWRPLARLSVGNVFWAGLAIALMLHGGLTTLMLPAGLGVLSLALLARLSGRGAPFTAFCLRGAGAVVFALCLTAAKIAAGVVFMSHFPRDAYALPGFSNALLALLSPAAALVLDSQTIWAATFEKLQNSQWMVFPHEWAYQFGFVFLLLLLCAAYAAVRPVGLRRAISRLRPNSVPAALLLAAVLLSPAAVLWYNPTWNAILKHVPLVKTTSFPFRWIIVLIPPACWLGARAWQAIDAADARSRSLAAGLAILLAAMLAEAGVRDTSYYDFPGVQRYSPARIDAAWAAAKGGEPYAIAALVDDPAIPGDRGRNDAMLDGNSFIRCYNPAYGYRLETLPIGRMHPGSVWEERDGFLNLKNPACLIWPKENACAAVGEEYRVSQRAAAEAFVRHAPIPFEVSALQRAANRINLAALILTASLLALTFFELIGARLARRLPRRARLR
jgi:hypothetical protein